MKKGCCLGCLGFLVLFGTIFTLVMFLAKPVVTCAETFLTQVSENHTKEAYASTAKAFKERISEAGLEEYCKVYGLDQYKPGSASWSNRGFRNNNGFVVGSFGTKDGKTIPLRVDMLYEDGTWKVIGLEQNTSGE